MTKPMTDIAIRVESLSKRYRIGARQKRANTLRETLGNLAASPFDYLRRTLRGPTEEEIIWALKDVSFEVQRGEVVGIIGRNGAGKTTLLQILSRITEPTEGQAEINGRVGSLLAVGTGFHPELTGRENIYLNGAILGMKQAEIERKFDEIVDFSGVEKFIDTPVKRYSSGMYVRLAFSVAAHLEPEILLVDEVLAVGDLAFQKKCLGKMEDVAEGGRTVLFVSHQMNSIRKLCERCIWLDAGHIQMADFTAKAVSAYERALTAVSVHESRGIDDANVSARFLHWEITEPKVQQPNMLTTLGPVTFKFAVRVNTPVRYGVHGINLWDAEQRIMWGARMSNLKLDPGTYEFSYALPSLPLHPGTYYWHVSLYSEGKLLDVWYSVPELIIGTEPLTHPSDKWSGVLNVPCKFQINRRSEQVR